MLRTTYIFFLLLWLHPMLRAQDNKPLAGFSMQANAFTGKVIKHTKSFRLPIPEHSSGMDLNLQWQTWGKKPWQQRRRYPVLGIGIAYTNYGIDSVYGRMVGIYPNLEIPLIKRGRVDWTIRIGDGAGFVSRKYSRRAPIDTLNNAISSTMNDFGFFNMDLRYRASRHLAFQAGINFSHISNASFHQPNLGINMWGYHLGLRYSPVTSLPGIVHRDLSPLSNRWLFQFRYTMAFTQLNAPLGPTYPVYIGTALASKRWLSKNKAFAGIDYSFHEVFRAFAADNLTLQETPNASAGSKMALLGGNEFLLGRVGVVLQVGYYVKNAILVHGKVYEKLGANLYLLQREKGPIKEAYLCAFLKTHSTVAELAEFGFGMSF